MNTDTTLVKTSHLQACLVSRRDGVPLGRLLYQENFHADYLSDHENLIAEAPFWALLEHA